MRCGVALFASRHCRVADYYEHRHDGSCSTKGEEIFEEFSDCELLQSDYDQWIPVSRTHPTMKELKRKVQHPSENVKFIQL